MSSRRLLVDAVAIIDCHKFGCWHAVRKCFLVETVEECFNECLRGANRRTPQPISSARLTSELGRPPHKVTKKMRAALLLRIPGVSMDDGERDLMAYAITQDPGSFILCGPDNALVRAACRADLKDFVVSLEEVARMAGVRKIQNLDEKNTSAWLARMRTRIEFET